MRHPQIGLTPISDGVEAPGFEPMHRLLAPELAPMRAEFSLEVSGVKVEGATMVERAIALRPPDRRVSINSGRYKSSKATGLSSISRPC
jgi:hypothetical protein